MLILSEELMGRIQAQAAESYPDEGCGLLLGRSEGGRNEATALAAVPNRWPAEEEKGIRFRIADADLLAVEMDAAARGLDVIGVYHSHPDHPPLASPRDLAWATWPGYSYLITEVSAGRPGLSRSWQLRPDRSGFDEETIAQPSGSPLPQEG
jgi:proteasome lid subunit RPN8/RPN11